MQLRVLTLRRSSYLLPFMEPRKTTEKASVAVTQEAWISGVSIQRVDNLMQAMGLTGIGRTGIFKLSRDIDERVGAFLDRPLTGGWPYRWLGCDLPRSSARAFSAAACSGSGWPRPMRRRG